MVHSYQKFWLGYRSFKERTTRSDFWLALLTQVIISIVLAILVIFFKRVGNAVLPDLLTGISWFFEEILIGYSLAAILPFLAIMTRRLRDAGMPWALIFLNLLPFFGTGALLIMSLLTTSESARQVQKFSGQLKSAKINEHGKISFLTAVKHYFTGYLDFGGRTTLASFWWSQLFFGGVLSLLSLGLLSSRWLDQLLFQENAFLTILSESTVILYLLFSFLPELAVIFRRLHDTGLTNFSSLALMILSVLVWSFWEILHQVTIASYGVHSFPLMTYLIFLIGMVLSLTLICGTLLSSDDLRVTDFSYFFRRKS